MTSQRSTPDPDQVISIAESISGDRDRAVEWLSQPLATFDGKTPLQLIAGGRADAVIGYLHSIESGFVG
ncbi:MbcA/ParS/Xre antitoxin family protein [Dyella sp. ASV21]|uniref:MbcA/ParS/Xre antitoxin family protein n=1 Tax=Dyella sp. ASV21 TaxID=2795114 RepID=UPI0018EBE1E4|nr:MbcA/ParS/Xre antitoxin family protein [Dyella sp. ASV21]